MSHYFYLAPEVLVPFSPLTSKEFELIRRKARELWQDETRWSASSVTTYAGSYAESNRMKPLATDWPKEQASSSLNTNRHHCLATLPTVLYLARLVPKSLQTAKAHQIWGSEAPCLSLPDYRTLCMKPTKPGFELLMNYRTRGKNLLKQLQRQQWDYESKIGSSEDSEMDRYSSDYSIGSSLIHN